MLSKAQGWTIVVVIVLGWFVVGLLPMFLYGRWASDPGTFGDTFGAANSLFSAAALAGIIISLFLQKKQLEEAIADQKDEMRLQTEQIKLQTRGASTITIPVESNDGMTEQQESIAL